MGLWTKMHFIAIIPAFAVFIVIAALLRKFLKDSDGETKFIPLKVISVILIVLEAVKQVESIHADGYDFYSLPLHFCSLFLYLLPLHSFYRGKHRQVVEAVTISYMASLFLFMLIVPTVVFGEGSINTYFTSFSGFHTVTFHILVCLYFVLSLGMKTYSFDTKCDLKVNALLGCAYMTVAIIFSHLLSTNYQNMLKCNFAPIESVGVAMVGSLGWIGQAIYTLVLFVMTIVFVYLAYFLTRGVMRLVDKRK